MKKINLALVGAAALIISGCSKKKPADLPPPPPSQTLPPATSSGNQGAGPVGNAVLPGSRADMLAQVGTDTVLFVTDSSDIDGDAQVILTRQAGWLKRYPNVAVTVEGHCDERGTREYNLALGDRRANSAKTFLINAGIAASRIAVISYGKERPVEEGSDESAWAKNRRAVTVVPM